MKSINPQKIGKKILDNLKEYGTLPSTTLGRVDASQGNLYSLAVQAYIYAFPWLYLSQLRWLWTSEAGKTIQEQDGGMAISAPINSFWCAPGLASSGTPTGGSPNADTLYSLAWCDLSEEPLILSVPEVTNRYYCIELSGIDSDTFGYVGTRATGTAAGNYLLASPNWHGSIERYNEGKELDEQILDVLPRPFYDSILLMGRTGITTGTQEDIQIANEIQNQYKLTTLSDWVTGESNSVAPKAQLPIGLDYNNSIGNWVTINRAMTQCPPGVYPSIAQDQLIQLFAQIGIGPNQDLRTQSTENLEILQQAAQDGLQILKTSSGNTSTLINNWSYPPTYMGKAGQVGDYLVRASLQALSGITAQWTIEAVYLNTILDSSGQNLSGNQDYTIEFTENSFPPFESNFNGFWSITLYNSSYQLIPNSVAYTINSNATEYQSRNNEGGMTILLQQEEPIDNSDGTYWLQTPTADEDNNYDDSFFMILRVYIPAPSVATTQTWVPPSVTRTS
ncbi:DUF1254 domain-containing protein [Dokdonia sp.]|uniref:DUF1254 domain-containing protein n=1 Tax=Dokdonia sp. TaxID=2024995 RepID=UPI003266698A